VPDPFRSLIGDERGEELSGGDDVDLSMDVDTRFLGTTQLYEPPPGTYHAVEYA